MEKKKVTIAILNYNGFKFLEKTIPIFLKIKNKDLGAIEVLIVDNNSDDGSLKFLNNFDFLRIVRNKENYGYSKGKNICVKESRGDYILLLDNDIEIIDSNMIKKLLSDVNKKEMLCIWLNNPGELKTKFYGNYWAFYGIKEKKPISCKKIKNYKKDFYIPAFNGGALFFKKSDWIGYDEIFPFNSDDIDMSCRLWNQGYKIRLFNKSMAYHLGDTSENFKWKFKYYIPGMTNVFVKNFTLSEIIKIIPFFFLAQFVRAIKRKALREFFQGLNLIFKNMKTMLKSRKAEEKRRKKIKDFSFLKNKEYKKLKQKNILSQEIEEMQMSILCE